MRLLLLSTQSGDWEGLYMYGYLHAEGHKLDDPMMWVKLGSKHDIEEIVYQELQTLDDKVVTEVGNFPENLEDLYAEY